MGNVVQGGALRDLSHALFAATGQGGASVANVAAPSDIDCYPCQFLVEQLKAQDAGGGGDGAGTILGRKK